MACEQLEKILKEFDGLPPAQLMKRVSFYLTEPWLSSEGIQLLTDLRLKLILSQKPATVALDEAWTQLRFLCPPLPLAPGPSRRPGGGPAGFSSRPRLPFGSPLRRVEITPTAGGDEYKQAVALSLEASRLEKIKEEQSRLEKLREEQSRLREEQRQQLLADAQRQQLLADARQAIADVEKRLRRGEEAKASGRVADGRSLAEFSAEFENFNAGLQTERKLAGLQPEGKVATLPVRLPPRRAERERLPFTQAERVGVVAAPLAGHLIERLFSAWWRQDVAEADQEVAKKKKEAADKEAKDAKDAAAKAAEAAKEAAAKAAEARKGTESAAAKKAKAEAEAKAKAEEAAEKERAAKEAEIKLARVAERVKRAKVLVDLVWENTLSSFRGSDVDKGKMILDSLIKIETGADSTRKWDFLGVWASESENQAHAVIGQVSAFLHPDKRMQSDARITAFFSHAYDKFLQELKTLQAKNPNMCLLLSQYFNGKYYPN